MRAAILSVAVVAAASSCRHFQLEQRPVDPARVEEERPSGVRIEDLFVGTGREAVSGDTLVIDYVATLPDKSVVASTLSNGQPVEVTIGSAFVRGLDEGLVGLRVNGRRRVHVPDHLAYGAEGVPGLIPPDTSLEFEVHVLELKSP